ncbi:M1 family metallopeptidase [Permianibacter sp. IMCC34836]|uniref:M1 family metallopeptidase n=1 Tax=Permianibacter fluminis TaxID=2738515 RepID=UPI001551DBDD|nr:M1 family metallopeptidase [Permianibacter fluminis]NQD38566.1 M1 family metallopeptidase [Permianibacter fluminis]
MRSPLRLSLAVLAIVAVTALLYWPTEAPIAPEPVDGRLPMLAVPDRYLLKLTILPGQPAFRGEVAIGLQLHDDTRTLYLHGRDLTVNNVLARRDGSDPITGHYQQLTPQGLARIDFDDDLPAGFLTLELQYDGQYTTTSEGLSRVQVGNDWYVFSQLHAVEARRVFPGFDDPAFKASFELEIISGRDDVVIGNSLPSETRELPEALKLTRLNRTPRMPTYLLNLSVGPFDVVNGPVIPANDVRKQPLSLRAVTVRGEGVRTRFALQHTPPMLSAFEQYFAIPFPFEKLDLIAVPDISSGVLENAGAINFLDKLMLMDEHASISERQTFISYNAHALAHQWFGDLVTMPWWDDLWLNEGFAEWLGYEIAAQSHPDYPLTLAMQQQLESAMQHDGRNPLLRIRQPLSREEDVQGTFNSMIYDKAMGLMRMYQRYLGNEQFRLGLRNYFARHAFGNAGSTELFQSMSDSVADPSITLSFDSFLQQPGLPQIQLEQQCVNTDLQLRLRQQAYAPAGSVAGEQQWQLPVCLRTPDTGHQACRMLSEREVIWSPGWRCDQLVVPNAGGAGYYRWQVADEHRQRLLAALPELPRAEALDIAANLTAAFRAGNLSADDLFQAMPILARHPDPAVLDSSLDNWRYLLQQLAAPPQRTIWQTRLQKFFAQPALIANEDRERQQFRALELQDRDLIRNLLAQHQSALNALKTGKPYADAQDPLALALAVAAEPSLLPRVTEQLQQETRSDRRAALIQALAWQTDVSMLPALQQLLLEPNLRINERWRLLQATLTSASLQAQQWPWLQQNFEPLLVLFPDYRHSQLIELAESLCDPASWQTLQQFLANRRPQLPVPASSIASTDSHIRECLALRQQLNKIH